MFLIKKIYCISMDLKGGLLLNRLCRVSKHCTPFEIILHRQGLYSPRESESV